MTDKLQEDTVSADRKERIIFDPEAWKKKDKSGRKTSAITSRQNFDNEKFTRKAKEEQVDEGTIQPSGDSKVDSAGPTQSDTISQDKKVKKSNNPQIEFVTGTATPNGSSSTAQGGAQAMGRKLAEELAQRALAEVKAELLEYEIDHDGNGNYRDDEGNEWNSKTGSAHRSSFGRRKTITSKAPEVPHAVHINGKKWKTFGSESHATNVAKKIKGATVHKEEVQYVDESQYAGLEKEDKPGKKATEFKGGKNAVNGKTVEGWKDEDIGFKHTKTTAVKEGFDPEQFGSDGSGAGGAGAGDIGKTDKKKKSTKVNKEETTMSKTYADFIQQLQEYNAGKDGVYRHKGTYGGSYDSNDDEDDDAPKAKPADAPKRGRGRPAGSKSGANQKVTTGKSYGGIATHSLSLPNSNR